MRPTDRPQSDPPPKLTNGRLPVDMCPQFINHFPALSLVSQPGAVGAGNGRKQFCSSQHCCNLPKRAAGPATGGLFSEGVFKMTGPELYYQLFLTYGVARVMRHHKWIDAIIANKMEQVTK